VTALVGERVAELSYQLWVSLEDLDERRDRADRRGRSDPRGEQCIHLSNGHVVPQADRSPRQLTPVDHRVDGAARHTQSPCRLGDGEERTYRLGAHVGRSPVFGVVAKVALDPDDD
jgi:hypothetical protein